MKRVKVTLGGMPGCVLRQLNVGLFVPAAWSTTHVGTKGPTAHRIGNARTVIMLPFGVMHFHIAVRFFGSVFRVLSGESYGSVDAHDSRRQLRCLVCFIRTWNGQLPQSGVTLIGRGDPSTDSCGNPASPM